MFGPSPAPPSASPLRSPHGIRVAVPLLALAFALAACEIGAPAPDPGRLEGSVRSARVIADDAPPFRAGEIVVGFAGGPRLRPAGTLRVQGTPLRRTGRIGALDVARYDAPGADEEATLRLAAALAERPDVRYAHPNYLVRTLRTPNDPLYPDQWHYPALDLPGAWDVTTGDADTVVAVVDSGMAVRIGDPGASHADLYDRVIGGYDFVSDAATAGDGDGRDADPYDPSAFSHGTHVAGTIGASTNNAMGVAGVDWRAGLLNARALNGDGLGTVFDVADALTWSAGLATDDAPTNPDPAHVINLSLGGEGSCYPVFQDALDRIEASAPQSAIVVVAAGNEAVDAGTTSPASCRGVIAVGATTRDGDRAWYSNHGASIDVMAPGGDGTDPIYSTSPYGGDRNAYVGTTGTSMAAPHVAGVVALMKALDPRLDRAAAERALTATATPLSDAACGFAVGGSEACGAGLVDARAALLAIRDGGLPTRPGALAFDPLRLDFGTDLDAATLTLTNDGDEPLDWRLDGVAGADANPAPLPDDLLTFAPREGALAPGAQATLDVALRRSALDEAGTYAFDATFEVDGGRDAATWSGALIAESERPPLSGPMRLEARRRTDGGTFEATRTRETPGVLGDYALDVPPGVYVVHVWSDENGDGVRNAGDFEGRSAGEVTVRSGVTRRGVDVTLEEIVGRDPVGGARPPGGPPAPLSRPAYGSPGPLW
ncbi:MAG: S8 family serine peptidase [Trueperaceae bacterium]|nr:S8 family serine peptidase [Trueperaceae bacterium]